MVGVSRRAKLWTVGRLENAIRATFFARAMELGRSEEKVRLRYTDIKRSIEASEGPLADRTLSRALAGLVGNSQLSRAPRGREVLYGLTIPRGERVRAFAKSDATAVEASARIGGMGDLTEGWACYGIPPELKDRLRPHLLRSSREVRGVLLGVVNRVAEEVIRSALRSARPRLPRRELQEVEAALRELARSSAVGWLALARGAMFWQNVEAMAPGALGTTRRLLGLERVPPEAPEVGEAHVGAWARMLGEPFEEVRERVAVELRAAERRQPLIDRLFAALGPGDGEKVMRELDGLLVLVTSLVLVVRP